ncbi:MAG: hypothetical protein JXA00_00860 [Candidatus Thermoplasmatota archaeon]|nr:hypothetical protein [Candidatus Thermoplasmatota archaeon]
MEPSVMNKKGVTHRSEDERDLKKWRESAFQVALEKLQETHGNTEMVVQTGEAFGRGLFAQRLQQKPPDWTMQQWVQQIEEEILKPLGHEFTFTKVSPDAATTFMRRDPRAHLPEHSTVASLFHYGLMRGLFLSAFPKGELVLSEHKATLYPEFTLKTFATMRDKWERERVKHLLTTSEEDNGN